MMRFVMGPDDWLGRKQGLCMVIIGALILLVGAI